MVAGHNRRHMHVIRSCCLPVHLYNASLVSHMQAVQQTSCGDTGEDEELSLMPCAANAA